MGCRLCPLPGRSRVARDANSSCDVPTSICEGCGRRRAAGRPSSGPTPTIREFLFELVALCRRCHERVHRIATRHEHILPLGGSRVCGCGWPVFPCKPNDKSPAPTKHGFQDATTDEATVRAWWERSPGALVGVDCGRAGLVVADVDVSGDKPGRKSWAALVAQLGSELEDTATTRTRSGGWHRYYRANGHHIKCSREPWRRASISAPRVAM